MHTDDRAGQLVPLLDIVRRSRPSAPWSEGDNIPWHEPGFSRRMLAEHLSQAHDAASRRAEMIDRHVRWIHEHVLDGRPTRILDLGCGPGLYCSRLARLGHECVGIDYSPASVSYAEEQAAREGLRCTYRLGDLRREDFRRGHGLALLIYGELNVFAPVDARLILDKAFAALSPGGSLVLEPHTFAAVERMGRQQPAWSTAERGLFSDRPYVLLRESFWDPGGATATTRYFVVDAATGAVTRLAQSMQAYTDEQYDDLLAGCGFVAARPFPSLAGSADGVHEGLFVLTATRP